MNTSSKQSKPIVIILAAGSSSRLFPLDSYNKGYISLMGKSLIGRTIESLQRYQYQEMVVVISKNDKNAELITTILKKDGINLDHISFVTQKNPHGQGQAILAAKKHIDRDFLIVAPYYFKAGPLADQLLKLKNQHQASAAFLGKKTQYPHLYGIIKHDGNIFEGVVEKPEPDKAPSHYKVISCYLFEKKFISYLEKAPQSEYSFEAAYTQFAQDQSCVWQEATQDTITLKYPWHLFRFQKYFLSNLKNYHCGSCLIASTAVIDQSDGPVFLSQNVIIGHAARIVGPCYIGPESLVGDFSLVRNSSLEKNVKVGAHTEIARSIVMEGSSFHRNYVGDSIVGPEVKFGAGCITANRRHDREDINIVVKDKKVSSHTSSFGTVIGEKTKLGISSYTMPGVLIGSNTLIYPNKTVFKNVSHNSVVE